MGSSKKKVILIVIAAAIVAAIAVCVGIFLSNNQSNCMAIKANPDNFELYKRLQCNVDKSQLVYSDSTKSDALVVNMTFKNVSKSLEYDKNARTADQVTPEEEANMSEQEKEEINDNTFRKYKAEQEAKMSLEAVLQTVFEAGGKILQPSASDTDVSRDVSAYTECQSSIYTNYEDAKSQTFTIGESIKVQYVFKLANQQQAKFHFLFKSFAQDEKGEAIERNSAGADEVYKSLTGNVDVLFDNENKATDGLRDYLKSKNSGGDSGENSGNAQTKSINGFNFKLVDGWYVASDGKLNIKLKNPDVSKATVQIMYSSGQTAQQQAQSDAQSKAGLSAEQTQINGKSCYKLQESDSV